MNVVKVLFVNVSVPVRDTKSSSLKTLLNSANVPDRVLSVRSIVLFVSVSDPASEIQKNHLLMQY